MGQLYKEIEANSLSDIEESLLETIKIHYGTIALVFYKRAKDANLLEDQNFRDIKLDLNCKFTLSIEINHFISEIFSKVAKCL